MYHEEENEPHPLYMKSNWNPPVQKSVALESYLEEVKLSLAEINLTKPKKEGINIVCTVYKNFYRDGPPIPKRSLKKALKLILQYNSFQFNKQTYFQTPGTAMGTKMTVAFANIFMAENETQILDKSANKLLVWKRYIHDIIFLWHTNRGTVDQFIEQANKHHPTHLVQLNSIRCC